MCVGASAQACYNVRAASGRESRHSMGIFHALQNRAKGEIGQLGEKSPSLRLPREAPVADYFRPAAALRLPCRFFKARTSSLRLSHRKENNLAIKL